jgi:chromosome partitioning protein
MNVITLASCKAGAGKTTLTAHLADFACAQGRRCLVIDTDPKGSFALYNSRRAAGALPMATAERGLERQLAVALLLGYEWVLIDTAAVLSEAVVEAMRAATMLIIPARPGFLDLAPVRETADLVRCCNKPYAVVLNAAPPKCDGTEALMVAESRAFLDKHAIPVWSGQISERTGFVPAPGEADTRSLAADELARLWTMIERSVEAMQAAPARADGEARAAA